MAPGGSEIVVESFLDGNTMATVSFSVPDELKEQFIRQAIVLNASNWLVTRGSL
jgi:hypothetical protein